MTETGYVPPNPATVRLMLSRTGLSLTEGAQVAGVEPRTLSRWLRGETDSRGEVIAPRQENWLKLVELCDLQDKAADEAMADIARQSATDPSMRGVSLVMAADDLDAKARGWPSHGAHVALIRRVAERCGVIGVPIQSITSGRLQDERTAKVERATLKPRAVATAPTAPAKPATMVAAAAATKPVPVAKPAPAAKSEPVAKMEPVAKPASAAKPVPAAKSEPATKAASAAKSASATKAAASKAATAPASKGTLSLGAKRPRA